MKQSSQFMVKLSIIIVNFNTKEFVLDCLDSIKKSKPTTNYEIIVIDNGSTDPIKPSKDFKLIKNSQNLGFAKANNQGIKVSSGEYVLLLNSDTLVKRGSIDKLIEFAQKNEDAGAIVPKLLNVDGTIQPSVFKFPSIWSVIKKYWFKGKGYTDKYIPETKTVDVAVMAAFLITPKALKGAGMLNERYFMFFEDFDYCRKLKGLGLKVYYLNTSEVTHLHGKSGKNLANEDNQWRRLIPSSLEYHGKFKHYLIYLIMQIGQKFGLYSILLPLLLIPTFFTLLKPGYFSMQDDLQAFRVQQLDKCLDDGQVPCRWVPDAGYGYGYPQFNYYPPLPYYIGSLLHRTGLQYIDTVKILFIAGYILSAFTMFILVSTLLDKWSGFVAALLYSYIPYKAVEVYVRGALSEFWAQIFFPLIFYLIYKVVKTGKINFSIALGVSVALLATTHTLMTIIFAPAAIIWALYWLKSEKWVNTTKVIVGGALGFGLSAFFMLPVAFERQFVHIESVLSGYFDYRQHFVSLNKLFISREWGYGSSGFPNEKLNLSLGIVQWLVGILVTLIAFIKFKKNQTTSKLIFLLSGLTLFSVFMIHMKSSFIWAKLPFLWYMQFPWRFLALSIFLLCLLSGYFIYMSGKFKYILGIIAIVISFCLSISFFVPKDWLNITDSDKFSGVSWQKQMTISIFDYLPIYATLPPINEAPPVPEIMDGKAEIIDYKKGSDFQTGRINVLEDATIRLPIFDFPGMQVKVNEEVVSHYNNDCRGTDFCYGLISFKLPKGEYKIEVELTNTPIRKLGNLLTILSIVTVIYLIVKLKSNKQ